MMLLNSIYVSGILRDSRGKRYKQLDFNNCFVAKEDYLYRNMITAIMMYYVLLYLIEGQNSKVFDDTCVSSAGDS